MSYQLIDVIQRLGKPRILVLGDLILDRYVWGDAERVSQEAPVILLREERQEVRLGGAANVANLLVGLNATAVMSGVVGADADGEIVRKEFAAVGVDCDLVVDDADRPTTVKQRFLGRASNRHPHQMLRVDREVRDAISPKLAERLVSTVIERLDEFDAILISDYAKGVCTPEVIRPLIAAAKERAIPVIVDPPANGDWEHYRGATTMTPNRLETKCGTGVKIESPEDAAKAGHQLCNALELDFATITLDSDGVVVVFTDGESRHFSTRRREVYDITGAGDMVLAMIGVGAAAGVEPDDLARLANVAGGLEVEQIGVVCISREQMISDLLRSGRTTLQKICDIDSLERHVESRKKLGQRIVFTNGCFDLLHPGHVHYLEEAATHGDTLVVGVNSDAGVRLHKGPTRPVLGQEHRARMLAALECVDHVIVFDEPTPIPLLKRLQPDVLVKGGSTTEIVGREVVEAYGGLVRGLSLNPGLSTTQIVSSIQELADAA